jgi:hypothetical protein
MKEGRTCGEDRFDSLTKGLDGTMSRRQALKWLGATTFGAVLSTLGVGRAQEAEKKKKCSPVGTCGSYQNCGNSSTCFCGADAQKGKAVCFEDTTCADATPCSKNKDCGKGGKCLEAGNCCGFALCVSSCGKGTSLRGTGPTAARG